MKITRLLFAGCMAIAAAACSKKEHVELQTVTPETGSLTQTVTATGTLEAVTQVDVGTQVTGIIDKLFVDYNSIVKKGELIAEIEKTVLESDLRSAEASVASAKSTYEYNQTNFKRDCVLHERQLISDYEFETSKKDLEVSKAAYDKALADKVRAAKNLNYAEIYSPIDGIVISREVEVGQTVVSNMSVANLYTIANLDSMQVIGNVDEADIGQVKVNQKVQFYVDAYPDDIFTGNVSQVRLSPTTESNVVTYEVVVEVANPEHKLIPGLTANLTIYVMNEEDAVLLPAAAFTFTPETFENASALPHPGKAIDRSSLANDQRGIWIVRGDSLINKIVTIGQTNGIKSTVIAGLDSNDKVAVAYEESKNAAPSSSATKSPFAPQPPGKKR